MNIQLSKTPIGLDGISAAESVPSHVDGERGELIIAANGSVISSARPASRRDRGCGAAAPASRSPRPPYAPPWARPVNAPSRGFRLFGITRGLSIVDGFRAALADARGKRTGARGHHRRRVSGDRGRAGAAGQVNEPCARST